MKIFLVLFSDESFSLFLNFKVLLLAWIGCSNLWAECCWWVWTEEKFEYGNITTVAGICVTQLHKTPILMHARILSCAQVSFSHREKHWLNDFVAWFFLHGLLFQILFCPPLFVCLQSWNGTVDVCLIEGDWCLLESFRIFSRKRKMLKRKLFVCMEKRLITKR